MNDEKPPESTPLPKDVAPPSGASVPQVEEKLETALKDLPPPKQQMIRETIQEVFMAVVGGIAGPKIDAETAKIVAASVDKDNEFRFQYLSQKQKDEAEQNKRAHDLEMLRHQDRVRVLRPVLYTMLFVVVGALSVGVYLAATGHEVLGSNILTAVITGLLAFLGGLGTMSFFKGK